MSVDGTAYFQRAGADGKGEGNPLYVQFNPTSLKVSLTNQFGEDPPEQHARATTAKLDVELLFDTTETGDDVRDMTAALRDLAMATGGAKKASSSKKDDANCSLPKVLFNWGTTSFNGIIESLNETLDYWSSDGVPLRATIQIAMKGTKLDSIASDGAAYFKTNDAPELQPELDEVVPTDAPPGGTGTSGAAAQGGDTRAGRALAASNGIEIMRAPTGAALSAGAGVSLAAAASFKMSGGVSAGAGVGFSIGASAGASASAGLGASVGVGMAAGVGIGAGAGFGASAGAGIGFGASASFGASAGAGIGFGASAGAGAGAFAGAGIGSTAFAGAGAGAGTFSTGGMGLGMGTSMSGSAGFGGGGFGITTSSTTSVTGFDGITHTETQSSFTGPFGTTTSSASYTSGSATAGVSASQGAFAGLGMSKTTLASASFNPDRFLGPPAPVPGPYARFDTSGRLVSGSAQVAAGYSYSKQESVVFF